MLGKLERKKKKKGKKEKKGGKKDDRKSDRTRQKNKRGDIANWDQTENPEIPDGGRHQKFPDLPSGGPREASFYIVSLPSSLANS